MNTFVAVILGIIIGFLAEWVFDWFYWRKKVRELESRIAELEAEGTPEEELASEDDSEIAVTDEQDQTDTPDFLLEDETEQAEEDADTLDGEENLAAIGVAAAVIDGEQDTADEEVEEPMLVSPVVDDKSVSEDDVFQPEYTKRLEAAGVDSPEELLERGSTAKGRAELAEETGLSSAELMELVNHAELYEIDGMSPEYANLLSAAGVGTAVDLASQDPKKLYGELQQANSDDKQVDQMPSEEDVQNWVQQAKSLPNVSTYIALRSRPGS